MHTVEKIGGTSMSHYAAVRDNIILNRQPNQRYQRIFVVSAYSGVTDKLLEHKKSGQPGIYALFANALEDHSWVQALSALRNHLCGINQQLFDNDLDLQQADHFINERLGRTHQCLTDLQSLCQHGHFALQSHLVTVREMLASVGEAHSAWNMARLLQRDGVNAHFVDLTGWQCDSAKTLDAEIEAAFADIDLTTQLPIVTGYAHCDTGLMSTFDRGYSEMTFSRIAVVTGAHEAIIHKEFHLSSADPRLVGEANAVPIGRTNYDVADQLANLGMEAIHPKAAKGLRQQQIALRVKNTFEPEHTGTLITHDYVSENPCVEIIAGRRGVYALELFDQEMSGNLGDYDQVILQLIQRFKASIISKDINANTITHYLDANLKTIKRISRALAEHYPSAEINTQKLAIVSAFGSDMRVPGILAQTVQAIASEGVSVLAIHQSMRQVDMQFIVHEADYEATVSALHKQLVEVHNHGRAIRLAS